MANTFKFGNGNWAVKDGYALAYNDENNNFKPLPFDFTRASSATTLNRQGLIETVGSGKPRIDFTDNTDGHLLLEPSRTNLAQRSEDFDNSYWQKVRATITANQIVSPDGSVTADLLTSTDTSENYCQQNVSSTVSGSKQTSSFFVKKGTSDFCHILLWDVSNDGARQWFDLTNGTLGTSTTFGSGVSVDSAQMINYGNGWYRCIVVFNNSNTTVRTRISASNSNGSTSSTSGKTIYIWGAQLETGSYATSYIPTEGSSVTRVVDDIELTFPDVDSFNSSVGFSVVSKFDIGAAGTGTSASFLIFNDDTSNTYIGFGSNSSNLRCRLNLSGTAYLNTQQNAPRTQRNSLFISCDANGWSQGANGVTNHTGNNDASVFNKMATITYTTSEVYGIIKISELLIYNTRLSDSELQQLTS